MNILLRILLILLFMQFSLFAANTLLEPPNGRVYHGVQTMTFEQTKDPLAGYLSAINDPFLQPAVRGIFFSIPGTRGPDKSLKELANFFHTADSVGFIPELSLFFVSDVATDVDIANSNKYDWILDSIITIYQSYGKRIFLRIGGEFNGSGEGWNGGGYQPYTYVEMFRKVVDKFAARGLRDSIAVNWCYEPDAPNDFDSVDTKGARWYPGDEYVDWFGLDVFNSEHFDGSLPDFDNRGITKKGKAKRFLDMAKQKGKPVFLSETSAAGINITSDDNDGMKDWNNWFQKFWNFIAFYPQIKGFCYIDANWPVGAYPNWGDARIENSPYIVNKYIVEMKNPKYIHLKQADVNGPWNNDLKIAVSDDGINFQNETIFQDSSGVPSVIKWKGDTLACVFQWFREPKNTPTFDKVAIKFSYNNGINWTDPIPVKFNNLPTNYQRPFDPTLAVTENKNLRMYFSSGEGVPSPGNESSINTYSAVSTDGLNFDFEPNPRYDNITTKVIDPAVIYFGNEWHYLSPAGAPQDGAFHCTSQDGINFVEKSKINSDNLHNWTGNYMVESENELRFYGSGANIWLNKSQNGYDWTNYINTNIRGGDPSTVKIADNKYIMIFVGQPNNIQNPPAKVVLISPINESTTQQNAIDLLWHRSMPNVGVYHLQVSYSNRFTRYVVNDSTLTDTTFNLRNLVTDSSYYWRVRAKNPSSAGAWSEVWKFKKVNSVSVKNNFNNEFLELFPNPASDFIEISIAEYSNHTLQGVVETGQVKLQIFNTLGIEVGQSSMIVNPNNSNGQAGMLNLLKIDISHIPAGVYFLRIPGSNGAYSIVKKFVKM
jgi:hypothetical protein